jgi:cell division protein FtsI/penicillin-binding protein 2
VHPARRIAICSGLVIVVFSVLTARVAQLQLMSGDHYQRIATEQALHTIPIAAERGTIFDRNGRDLALSVKRTTIYADPTLVDDPIATAAKLVPVLGVDQNYLVRQLSSRPHRFAYLARTVPDDVATAVKNLGLAGIGFMPESARSYPADPLAGDIVGHVGGEGTGLDGTEYLYNTMLQGTPGELVVEQDPQGHDIPNTQRTRVDARRGTDVVLTLDEDLQWKAEYTLLDQVQATQAQSGMAAIIDVTTGDVVAMASVNGATAQDPAHVAKPGEHNMPLTDLYSPGSTMKLVTLSWALERGYVTPETVFDVKDSIRVDPHPDVKPYVDAESHPESMWSVSDILRESSNVGTIMIAQKMKNREVADSVRAFGLARPTSIAWPGQPDPIILSPDHYYATGKYSTAIGYGAAVTGMQMLDAFTTIANGGVTRAPRLLDATIDANGVRRAEPSLPGTRVVSTTTADEMTRMMEGVVSNGTGACAAIRGYPVAGKTGTAKKLLPDGTYSDTETIGSFIGYAPADHPRFAAIVVLDAPSAAFQFGGASAAPVWSEMMQFALTQYNVAPTDPTDTQYNAAHATAQYPCTVPHGDALAKVIAAAAQAQQAQQAQQTQQSTQSQTGTAGSASGVTTAQTQNSGTKRQSSSSAGKVGRTSQSSRTSPSR